MQQEIIFRIVEIILQLLLVLFAGMALLVWKKEIRGKERYKQAKEILDYIKEIGFLIHSKDGSMHQIFLNDILVDRSNFYNDQLRNIKNEKIYFDQSIWGLFSHINIRSDISLPKKIRTILGDLCPISTKPAESDKVTYIQLRGIKMPKIENFDFESEKFNRICKMSNAENVTIEMYFIKWEKLLRELQKLA